MTIAKFSATAAATGTYSVTVTVTDSTPGGLQGDSASTNFAWTVTEPAPATYGITFAVTQDNSAVSGRPAGRSRSLRTSRSPWRSVRRRGSRIHPWLRGAVPVIKWLGQPHFYDEAGGMVEGRPRWSGLKGSDPPCIWRPGQFVSD